MSIAIVGHGGAGSSDNNVATASIADTTGATLLFAFVSDYNAVGDGTLTDSVNGGAGNTWVECSVSLSTLCRGRWYYAKNPARVGITHTATYTATGSFPSIEFIAVSASNITGPLDQQNTANGTATSLATGSVTPTTVNQIVLTGISWHSLGNIATTPTGFTAADQVAQTPHAFGMATAYLIQTSIVAENPSWPFSQSSDAAGATATFFPLGQPPAGAVKSRKSSSLVGTRTGKRSSYPSRCGL
jgi:hypothetical protein